MKTLTRLFGNDIMTRTVIGVLLGVLVVLIFVVPVLQLPVLGVVWLIATVELIGMARRPLPWQLVVEWIMVSAGMVVIIALLAVSWQWALVIAIGVVATDVLALISGRLAKAIPHYATHRFSVHSPSKTWEGVIGGCVGSVLSMGAALMLLALPLSGYVMALVMAIPLVAVWGDFFESRLKREVGVKDASNLLGPHGGLVDRLDSICPVFATVGLVMLIMLSSGML